jgi:hypothetical protein
MFPLCLNWHLVKYRTLHRFLKFGTKWKRYLASCFACFEPGINKVGSYNTLYILLVSLLSPNCYIRNQSYSFHATLVSPWKKPVAWDQFLHRASNLRPCQGGRTRHVYNSRTRSTASFNSSMVKLNVPLRSIWVKLSRLLNWTRLGYCISGLRKDYGKRYVRDPALVIGFYQTIILPVRDKRYL